MNKKDIVTNSKFPCKIMKKNYLKILVERNEIFKETRE